MPKSVWLGATMEHTPRGYATGEQQRQTGLGAKTFRRRPLGYGGTSRATVLLPLGFVVAVVKARHGDAPTSPPRPRPKSQDAAPFPILRPDLSGFGFRGAGPGQDPPGRLPAFLVVPAKLPFKNRPAAIPLRGAQKITANPMCGRLDGMSWQQVSFFHLLSVLACLAARRTCAGRQHHGLGRRME